MSFIWPEPVWPGVTSISRVDGTAFIDNPFGPGKLYRTGDLVHYLTDGEDEGNLAFVGRIDDQVKIRGFRIELAEIEHQLASHEAVASCLLTALNNAADEPQLVAYVIPESDVDQTLLASQLKVALHQVLPDYMLPSAFVFIDRWPLSANGKIDRKALPAPNRLDAQTRFCAPVNDTERRLLAIFANLLQLDTQALSCSANFFALGGHSLLGVKLVAAVRSTLAVEITLIDVFEHPTIQGLASHISNASQQPLRSTVQKQNSGDNVLPLSFAQQRLWFVDQLEGGSAHYNMPTALAIKGAFDVRFGPNRRCNASLPA